MSSAAATQVSYYAVIPASVRYDDTIPANAKLLYGEISALIGKDGFCYATNQYFSDLYGVTNETIARLITKLEKADHIKRVIDRDESGQIISRKLYLKVSMPDGWGIDKKINTPRQKNQEGIDEKVKETDIGNIYKEKENIQEKETGAAEEAPPGGDPSVEEKKDPPKRLSDDELKERLVSFIKSVAGDNWTSKIKNQLFFALLGFYAPRESKKTEPSRAPAAVTALTNKLLRDSRGSPLVMMDMLERATIAKWKSVYPPSGTLPRDPYEEPPEKGSGEEWL